MRTRLTPAWLRRSILLLLGGALGTTLANAPFDDDQTLRNEYPGTPVPGLSPAQTKVYERGEVLFSRMWKPENGLGPHLNANACMTCHHNPLPGGNEFAPARFVAHSPSCHDRVGGNSCPKFRIAPDGAPVPLELPSDVTFRKPQSLFGIGMLEAVADETLLDIAATQQSDPDGVRGVPGRTRDGKLGRFGWKARFAHIDDFVSAAFNAEFGMTSAQYPADGSTEHTKRHAKTELDPEMIASTSAFLRGLAAPPVTPRGNVRTGASLFQSMRCTACHIPSLRTGTSSVHLLSDRTVYPYTDLLLHDMGQALADGIDEGGGLGAKFRTPPLWGLNASGPPYLHDGRAGSVREAILMHGGEALRSVERFRNLSDTDIEHLLRFLNSL